jgi:phosphoesterase RecJ-like protein
MEKALETPGILEAGIWERIGKAEKIAIGGHVRPDGDCVGSSLALWQYLRKKYPGKKVEVYLEQPSVVFSYLKGFDEICTEASEECVDLFLALDSSSLDRLDFTEEMFHKAGNTICIDHHISNTYYAGMTLVRPEVSSTAEVVYELLLWQAKEEGMTEEKFVHEVLGCDMAAAFYTGIVHDTGVFKFSNTSPRTMRIAAYLIGTGIPFSKIIDESFYQKTYTQTQIMGRCLLESIRVMEGRVIFSALTQEIMKFYGVKSEDLNGIIDQLRIIKGVEVAILIHEKKPQEYKVSMRSNGVIDVQKAAVYFGGGGHVKAAGCTMKGGSVHDVMNNLTRILETQFIENLKS